MKRKKVSGVKATGAQDSQEIDNSQGTRLQDRM